MLGTPASLARPTLEDARRFAERFLVPANAILTVTGRFDVVTANGWIDRTVGRLPGGTKAGPPTGTRALPGNMSVAVPERFSRKPRVTLAWALTQPLQDTTLALNLGAVLLTLYTDGFVGMRVNASLDQYSGGAIFSVDVTMPHATDKNEAATNAEVVYRYLSRAVMPPDLAAMTFHSLDRIQLARLSDPSALASVVTSLELHPPQSGTGLGALDSHWRLTPAHVQALSARALRGARLTIQARPLNPLPRKEHR